MITTFYPPYSFGGDALFVQRLSNELARRGHHVEVIHCVDAYRLLAGRDPAGTYEDSPGVIVHGLRSPVGPISPLATQQTGFPLFKSARIRQVLDKGFDVIHFHNISLVGGPGILSYGRGLKLYTMHEHWLVCPTHVLFKYNREICQRRNCFACQISHGRPPQLWRHTRLLRTMAGHVDAFIAPSQFVRAQHELQRGRALNHNAQIVVLPNFVPQAAVTPALPRGATGDGVEKPYFLFVGRLERLKGVQTLIPVFRRHRNAALAIAGSGSLESELRHLAGGCANIRFLGQQSADQVRALMSRAVALIVPSVCFEAFPTVTIEAFAQGTPAIVRDIGSLPEQIERSAGGLVYGTDEELVGAMDSLLADPAYRDVLGQCGYRSYKEHWTPAAHIGRYLALIRTLSSRHRQQACDTLGEGAVHR